MESKFERGSRVLLLDFSKFPSIKWDYDALYRPSTGPSTTQNKERRALNLRLILPPTRLGDSMDDESDIINEAGSRLEILFSAQTEEVKRLLTTTVKGKPAVPSYFVAF